MCQWGGWALKGVDTRCVLVRMLGPKGGWWIGGSHIDWRREWVLARTLGLNPKGGGLWDPTSVGKENETFFIRVGKPLPSRYLLKTLRGSSKGKTQRGQYLLAVDLGCYKSYQSQRSGHVPARRLSPEGGWTQGGVLLRMLGSEGGWIGGSHIDWRRERVPAKTLDSNPKGGGLWDPTLVVKENEAFFIRVWKPFLSRHVSKTLRGSPKRKTQKGQYLLAVDLDCYK